MFLSMSPTSRLRSVVVHVHVRVQHHYNTVCDHKVPIACYTQQEGGVHSATTRPYLGAHHLCSFQGTLRRLWKPNAPTSRENQRESASSKGPNKGMQKNQTNRSAKNMRSTSEITTNLLYVSKVLDEIVQPTCKFMSSMDIFRRLKMLTVPRFTPCVYHWGGVRPVYSANSFSAYWPSKQGCRLVLPNKNGLGASAR